RVLVLPWRRDDRLELASAILDERFLEAACAAHPQPRIKGADGRLLKLDDCVVQHDALDPPRGRLVRFVAPGPLRNLLHPRLSENELVDVDLAYDLGRAEERPEVGCDRDLAGSEVRLAYRDSAHG